MKRSVLQRSNIISHFVFLCISETCNKIKRMFIMEAMLLLTLGSTENYELGEQRK